MGWIRRFLCRIGLHKWKPVYATTELLWPGPILSHYECVCGAHALEEYTEDGYDQ